MLILVMKEEISDRVLPEPDNCEMGIFTCSIGLMGSTAVNKNSSYMDSESDPSKYVQNTDQYGFEVCDEFLSQNDESVKHTAMVNEEIALPDLESVSSETDLSDHSDSDMFSYVSRLSLQPVEAHALPSSSIYSVQHTEPVFSVQSKLQSILVKLCFQLITILSHGVGISAHASDKPSEVCSGYPLLPAVPQIDLAKMPPLAPLPPAQWRLGRTQLNAFLPSDRDSVHNTFGLFPPMFPLKVSNDTEKGSPVSTDDLLSPVPVLQPLAVKDEDLQRNYQNLLGNTAQSDEASMQMPLTSNDGRSNLPTSDSTSLATGISLFRWLAFRFNESEIGKTCREASIDCIVRQIWQLEPPDSLGMVPTIWL
ncbi:hypothetical protein POM88_054248 [Heracleum sosnowskyi]|uniref:Uncharacterized protein n=1 Tax=Heracleum sosnowskyi TaxID=360622 RepID=A0AAD8GN41_9APIA|nr:hypothetical protein POM88_054248 [Heracleum sosnowskyi]